MPSNELNPQMNLIALTPQAASDGEVFNIHEDGSVARGQLRRYLKIMGPKFDEMKGLIDAFPTMIDVDTTDADFLPLIAELVGVRFNREIPIPQAREEIKQAVQWYKRKTTLIGSRIHGYKISRLQTDIVEFWRNIKTSNRQYSEAGKNYGPLTYKLPGDRTAFSYDFANRSVLRRGMESASSEVTGHETWRATDGIEASSWQSGSPAPAWLMYTFDDLIIPLQFKLKAGRGVEKFRLQWADYINGMSWLSVNMRVSGYGIPDGAELFTIDTTTSVTLTQAATATSTQTIYFSIYQPGILAYGSPVIQGFTDTSQMRAGMSITGPGIPSGSLVLSVDTSTSITISNDAEASGMHFLKVGVFLKGDLTLGNTSVTNLSDIWTDVAEYNYGDVSEHTQYLGVATSLAQTMVLTRVPLASSAAADIYEMTGYGAVTTELSVAANLDDTYITLQDVGGLAVDDWLEIYHSTYGYGYYQIKKIEGNLVHLYTPIGEKLGFPVLSLVKSITATKKTVGVDYTLDSWEGLVTLLAGQFTTTNHVFSDTTALNDKGSLEIWQTYTIDTLTLTPHTYWRFYIDSTWDGDPEVFGLELWPDQFYGTYYRCERLGYFFTLGNARPGCGGQIICNNPLTAETVQKLCSTMREAVPIFTIPVMTFIDCRYPEWFDTTYLAADDRHDEIHTRNVEPYCLSTYGEDPWRDVITDRLLMSILIMAPVATASRTRSLGIAIITTATPHGLKVGQPIHITGIGGVGYNGYFTVATTPNPTVFTYANPGANEGVTPDVGGLIDTTKYIERGSWNLLNPDGLTWVSLWLP